MRRTDQRADARSGGGVWVRPSRAGGGDQAARPRACRRCNAPSCWEDTSGTADGDSPSLLRTRVTTVVLVGCLVVPTLRAARTQATARVTGSQPSGIFLRHGISPLC